MAETVIAEREAFDRYRLRDRVSRYMFATLSASAQELRAMARVPEPIREEVAVATGWTRRETTPTPAAPAAPRRD